MNEHIIIPRSAADEIPEEIDDYIPPSGDAYIPNLCKGKEFLTVVEALEQISRLSGMILADTIRREHDGRRKVRE